MSAEEKSDGSRGLLAGILVLAAICLASGLGLGLLYSHMKEDIEDNRRQAFLDTLGVVLPGAETDDTVGTYADGSLEDRVYAKQTSEGLLYAAMGSAQGYQSQVKVLVSVKGEAPEQPLGDNPKIHRMAVVSSQETPGLGQQIQAVEKSVSVWAAAAGHEQEPKRPWFQEQFSGKRLEDLVVEKQEDTDKIAALTGATITSRAATEATRKAVQKIINRTRKVYGQ